MSAMETSVALGSVFTTEYLEALALGDEPAGAAEGELAGPWKVVAAGPGRWEVVRLWEEPAEGGVPRVAAADRETALLFAATLPGLGRSRVFRPCGEGTRLQVEGDGRAVAELAGIGEEAVAAAHVAACLARSSWALAMVIEAAGPAVQREVGEILFQRMR